jgi:hypothetical protein
MNLAAAVRRFPVLVLLPVVVFVAAGITLGLRRHPIYTASSEINVGVPNVISQATPGYVEAAVTLASAYSRQVNSHNINQQVAKHLGLSTATVASRLSSAAVPSSPTFFINGTGPSVAKAIQLTNAATAALQKTINSLQQGEGASPSLLRRYRALQDDADRLASNLSELQAQPASTTTGFATTGGGTSTTAAANAQATKIRQAKVDAQAAELQAQALAGLYTQSATSTRGAIIEVLNPPTGASSDRRSVTERYGLIGLVAGLVMGTVLTLMVATIRDRRTIVGSLESAPSR